MLIVKDIDFFDCSNIYVYVCIKGKFLFFYFYIFWFSICEYMILNICYLVYKYIIIY